MMMAKGWPANAWSARRRMFSTNKISKGRIIATDPLTTILASCPPREAGAPPPRKTQSSRLNTSVKIRPEATKGAIDLSALSQETTLLEVVPPSHLKSPKDGVNISVPTTTKLPSSFESATELSAQPLTHPTTQNAQAAVRQSGQSSGTSFDVMAAWPHFVAPAATPDRTVTEDDFVEVTKDIRNIIPDATAFLSLTQQIVASIQKSSDIDIELSQLSEPSHRLHFRSTAQSRDPAERSVEGTLLPPSSPFHVRPLPLLPTICSTNHILHDKRSDLHAQAGASIMQNPTPQAQIIPYPPIRLSPDTRTQALVEHIRGFKEISEELDYASDTDEMLNELKWALRVDPTTVDFGTKQFQAFDPHMLNAVPEPVHIGIRWAQALEVMTKLSIRIRRFSEGARDCIQEVHTENFLLKRRVCEMEAKIDVLPSEVEELREKVKKIEASLDMVLNSGIYSVTSTRMADHSLDRVSKAMQQTPPGNTPNRSSRQREQTPYVSRARKPLRELVSPAQATQPSTLRRPISNGWKRKQKYPSPVRASASTDENVEDELMAAYELRDITRAIKPAPLRIRKISDGLDGHMVPRITKRTENLTASGRAILDPTDEAVFDNDSQIW